MGETAGGDSKLLAYVPAIQAEWLASNDSALWRDVEGSLVFADVSGFTPLTERLARRGKVGAEELTDVLNEVFTALLDVAESYGGDLLKFGGDALLLLFTGEAHAARAAAGAAGMQAALRPYRRFKTNGGTVSLRMSVGVNSGTFQLFLVGGSHRELLVAGPASSHTAELEAAADAGEVLLGGATAKALPARHVAAPKLPGVLLRGSPVVDLAPLTRPPAEACTEMAVPIQLRPHLRSRRDDGEHRVAVLTFIQFKGTDDLLASEGPEAVAAELDALVRSAQDACEAFGVTFLASDVDKNGGKILLSAGAPTAAADDADRMLHALRAIVLPERRLHVRAGVNRGRAFAVDVGSPVRRTYAVMGDPTNLAARVMGKAEPRTVLATDAVVAALRDRFNLVPVEPFMVKGKSMPIKAQVVGEALGRVAAGRDLPLVGRDEELAALDAALERASRGTQTVALVGEPGSGKSRLLDEFLMTHAELSVLRVEAAQYATASPYFAVRGAMRRVLGIPVQAADDEALEALRRTIATCRPDLEPMVPLLAVPLGLDVPDTPETADVAPAFRRARLHDAAVDLLSTLLPESGLLVLEDAHWLDAASASLVQDVLGAWQERRWLACVTTRPEGAGQATELGPDVERVDLAPLDHEARRRLVEEATLARPLPDHVLDALAERSGGNPLFLGELVNAVLSSGSTTDLPDSVEALIASRIDTLLPEERTVLRQAAVLGARLSEDLLTKLVASEGHPSLDTASVLQQLAGFFEVEGEGRLRFRQSVVREVAYECLPYRQRRRLHAQAGDLIESSVSDPEEFSDLLSLHFLRAQVFDKAWSYARTAGERARHNAAPVEAAELFRRALEAARPLSVSSQDLVEVQIALAEVAALAGEYESAASALQNARRLTPPSSLVMVELCRRSGWLRERAGRYEDALRWYSRGLRTLAAQNEDSVEAKRVHAELSMSSAAMRVRQGQFSRAIPLLEEAVELAQNSGDRKSLAHAYYLLDAVHTDLGNPEAAHYRELALPIYEELGDWEGQASVLNNLGVDAYFEGRWADAIELYERSREARVRAGDMVEAVTASHNIAEILSDQGHVDEARALFSEALRSWRASRFPVGIGIALSNLGRAASRSGQFTEAAVLLAEATAALKAIGSDFLAMEAQAREVERLVFAGDQAAAGRLGRALLEVAGGQQVLQAMLERLVGYTDAQAGDLVGARDHLDRSLRIATTASAEFEAAQTYEALARVGRIAGWPDAAQAKARAAELFSMLGVTATPEVPLVTPDDPGDHG